ncbi:MAG TPA: hypothetical protein VLQ68_11930 [Rhizobiaceae bacterium]|nr:hypothetical protein [Rhizobiaceae bacterium]
MPSRWTSTCLRLLGFSVAALTALGCSTLAPGAAVIADPVAPTPASIDAIVAAAAAANLDDPGTAALSIGVSYLGQNKTRHFARVSAALPIAPNDQTLFPIASQRASSLKRVEGHRFPGPLKTRCKNFAIGAKTEKCS